MMDSFGVNPDNKNDELYQFKMKQYKELSHLRNEQQKLVNEQQVTKLMNQHQANNRQRDLELQAKAFDDMLERVKVT